MPGFFADRAPAVRLRRAGSRPLRVLPAPAVKGAAGRNTVWYSTAGRWLVSDTAGEGNASFRLWDLMAPSGAGPLALRTKASDFTSWNTDPLDRGFVAAADSERLFFWSLPRFESRVFDWHEGLILSVAFTADGATLVAATSEGDLRAWPLSAEAPADFRTLPKANRIPGMISAAPTRREIVVGSSEGRVQVIPVDGGEPRELEGLSKKTRKFAVAFSPDGRRVAATPLWGLASEKRIHVWDLESGAVQVLEPVPRANDEREGGFIECPSWARTGSWPASRGMG